MALNSYDRDRLLVAVHDGLDAVIGDRVRWKPRGNPAGSGFPRETPGFIASENDKYFRRAHQKRVSRKNLRKLEITPKVRRELAGARHWRETETGTPYSARPNMFTQHKNLLKKKYRKPL